MLWTSQELNAALNLRQTSCSEIGIHGVSIDSRTLSRGDLFIALDGISGKSLQHNIVKARDGHKFISAAESNGAAAVICSKKIECKIPSFLVNDTLDALWDLAKFARDRMNGEVLAITGSAGKTTSRAWLEQLLRAQGSAHASVASYNNHWGVPLSLSRMPADADYGIFEVGMNHRGEIAPLSMLIRPQVALVLNVLPAHIGHLGTLNAIRREKLDISKGLVSGGTLLLPFDLDQTGLAKDLNILTFGLSDDADISGKIIERNDPWLLEVKVNQEQFEFSIQSGGEHLAKTALATLAAVYALGGNLHTAVKDIDKLGLPSGRGNLLNVSGRCIIDDSYNANVVSMQCAIDNLGRKPGGKKIALLGEMKEVGDHGPPMHHDVLMSCEKLDAVITVGRGFYDSREILGTRLLQHAESSGDIDLDSLVAYTEPGDTILVKGSNAIFWRHQFVDSLVSAMKNSRT